MKHQILPIVASVLGVSLSSLQAQILISDNFESDTSANYTLVDDGTPDYSAAFAFDYVAAGIPLAPRSTAGDTGGLRLTANDTLGAADQITAFHNTLIGVTSYILEVDIYMGVTGSGGTTEMTHVGVGGDGVTFNSIFTPISGSGSFFSMTGEGGSSSDYRWFNEDVTSVPTGDDSYQSDAKTTNASDPYYQALFPDGDFPGSPGNMWTTLRINVNGSDIGYFLDDTPIVVGSATLGSGYVSLGYNDPFSSVANPFQSQFGLYDNLVVTVPEPASIGLALFGGLGLLLRARRRH